MHTRLRFRINRIWKGFWPLGAVLRVVPIVAAVLWLRVGAGQDTLAEAMTAGLVAREAEDWVAAEAAYRQALAFQPWEISHLRAVVEAEVRGGAWQAAEEDLRTLEEHRPLTLEEQTWWVAIHAGQDRIDEAILTYSALRDSGSISDSVLGEGLDAIAEAHLAGEDWEQARLTLEQRRTLGRLSNEKMWRLATLQGLAAVEQRTVRPSATETLQAVAALNDRSLPRAARLLGALESMESDRPDLGYLRVGVALLNSGENRLAEIAFERSVAHNTSYAEALAYLGLTQARQNKGGLGAAMQASALGPDRPVVQYLVGLTWKEAGDPHQARQRFEQAYLLDPSNPAFALEVASTHRLEDDPVLAEAWMAQALSVAMARGGDTFEWRLRMAQFYIDDEYEVVEKGLPLIETLVAERPEDAEAHATLAWAYFQIGELQDAFVEMDTALSLDPYLARAHAHRGVLLESQNRVGEAIDSYAQALALDPDGPYGALAQRALERISEQ